MDNSFNRNSQFADKLERSLLTLAQKWGVGQNDPRIKDIRRSGQAILDEAKSKLDKIADGDPYKNHQEFFVGLTHQFYTPRIQGSSLLPNSDHRDAAHKLLKDLANYIGGTIDQDNRSPSAPVAALKSSADWFEDTAPQKKQPIAAVIAIKPAEKPQNDDNGFEWTYHDIPKPEVIDESKDLRDEESRIKEIVGKALSPKELRDYIKNTLIPRLTEVNQELKAKRASADSETLYEWENADLIGFAASLETLMLKGLRRATAETKKALSVLETELDAGLEKVQGAQLKDFYQNRLRPKLFALDSEIAALKKAGVDKNAIHEKECHFNIIKDAMKKADGKMQAEKEATVPTAETTVLFVDDLQSNALALAAEIKTMKEAGTTDPAVLKAKERHLYVLETSRARILEKSGQSAQPELIYPSLPVEEIAAVNTPVALWTPKEDSPFKFPDATTAQAVTNFSTLLPAEKLADKEWLNNVQTLTEVIEEKTLVKPLAPLTVLAVLAAPQAAEVKSQPTTAVDIIGRDIEQSPYYGPNALKFLGLDKPQSEPTNDINVVSDATYIDRQNPEEPKAQNEIVLDFSKPAANEPSFWKKHFKRAAAVVVGVGRTAAAFAIAATVHFSNGHAPDAQVVKKAATPEPTAQAVQQAVVQQPVLQQQPTVNVAAAPANDVASAPIAAVDTPEPTVDTTATTTLAPVKVKAPAFAQHFVAKAKVAAPTVDVQDNTPLVEKTWDIETSRVDLETWNNACKALNQQNLTVSGVCPS